MKLPGCVLLLLGLLSVAVPTSRAERLIGEGDTWRYHKGRTANPPQQPSGVNWTERHYDDSSNWSAPAPSGFGFGDCDDATSIADMTNAASPYVTLFIRRPFVVADPAQVTHLTLAADYDDGFVAYINGVEVARGNMAAGATNYNSTAAGNHESSRGQGGSSPNPKEFLAVTQNPATLLVPGTNVLAVSGHNVSSSSSDFSLIIELYAGVTLVRGPFIQMPRSNEVTVVWRTDALTDSAVDYGLTPACEAGTITDAALVREHVIDIPGLLPGTNYHYRVRSGGVTLSDGNVFRTKAAPGQPFRFVVLGDFGQGTAGMSNIAARINARTDFDFQITVGDNIYGRSPCALDGAPGWYDPFWFSLYATTMARVATFVTLGNHDVDTANGQFSIDYFQMPTNGPAGQLEKNFSFDYGNAHFAIVDTEPFQDNNAAVMTSIRTWLSNDLAAATQPWKFVFLHRPPHTSVGSHDDQANVKAQLAPLFRTRGVQFVFQGHNHWYERINAVDGVHYLTSAASGASLYTPSNRKAYSAVLRSDVFSYTVVDVSATRLTLQQFDANGVLIDEFSQEIGTAFRIDGLLDNPAWLRADNGLRLYAAIHRHQLYLASQDAGEGGDNFIYLHNTTSTNRPANWAKSGQVMQWNCFLADENDNAFQGWFGGTGGQLTNFPLVQSMTSGLNNNGAAGDGVLEGALDLVGRFGTFPGQLHVAAAAFGTADGGVRTAQVPAGDGDGNITADEFLVLNTRDIALDLPVANAVAPANIEAGMPGTLDGSGSTAPSGLPLTYFWTQLTGPPATLGNGSSPSTTVVATTNQTGVATFRLNVNDTRFDSNSVVTVHFNAILDSDGDGLSDLEETTGTDNVMTLPNPDGQVTDPLAADTDGDGMNDGAEVLAGTNPNSAASVLRVTGAGQSGEGFRLAWPSTPGKTYVVEYREELTNSWQNLATIIATGMSTNHVDASAAGVPKRFYRVVLLP